MPRLPSVLLLGLLLAACDTLDPVQFDEQVVVESYLVLGESLPPVRLSRSAPVDAVWDAESQALSGATVFVHRLDEAGEVAATHRYVEEGRQRGVYRAVDSSIVRPLTRYRLEVELPDGEGNVEAETVVPGTFDLVSASHDTLRYQAGGQLVLGVSPSEYPDRQSIYILTTESFDPTYENLTPVYRYLVDEGTFSEMDLRIGASPILNEANYERGDAGEIIIRLPWLAVPFYGRSQVNINVIDDNLYDFLRSQSVQQGGSTLPPGEIPNVIDHVSDGTGVFGSYAGASHEIYVVP